jgi:integrase
MNLIHGIRFLAKERFLPKHVSSFKDRHGKTRFRFRKVGCKTYYFQHPIGTEEFLREYRHCLTSVHTSDGMIRTRDREGSVNDLVSRYLRSSDFKGEARQVTLSKNRAIIERFRKMHGERMVAHVTFEPLDKIIAEARIKNADGTGGNFAAQKLRKELKRLFGYAVKLGWLASNPVDHIRPLKLRTDGFHSWTDKEVEQYQNHWAVGTRQRLALELILWTGKRIGDAAKLGPQHIIENTLVSVDSKTQKLSEIALSKDVLLALAAVGEAHGYLITGSHGRGYSEKSLSQTFSEWCNQAGLPHCSAHGLRKTITRRMAESGLTNAEMKSITQHTADAELAVYTRGVNQKNLSTKAIQKLSDTFGMKSVG